MALLVTSIIIIQRGEAVYIIKDGSGVGTVSYVTGKCSATGTLNTLQAKDGYSLQYLYYLLKVFNFEPYKTGMAIPHIYFKDYGKAKVFCPSYTEQLQYARLLSAIDSKLSVEKNTLRNFEFTEAILAPPDVYMNIWRSRYCFVIQAYLFALL